MSNRKGFSKDVDKRAHHNALEKQRRDDIKTSFDQMRDSVPDFAKCKTQPTKKKILNGVANYILRMESRNAALQKKILSLKKDNKLKREQLRILKRAKERKDFNKAKEVLKTINFDDEEESDEPSIQSSVTIEIPESDSESESSSSSSSSEKENLEADSDMEEVPSNYNQILFNMACI